MSALVLGVRHGEVENPSNVIYARMPGFGLSKMGREQVASLAESLRSAPLVAVVASPLQRAQETAEILARTHGLPVTTDERLLEWSFWTRWQGIPWAEVRARSPETFTAYGTDPGSLHNEDPLEGVGDRILEWAREAAGAHPAGVVVGVSHEAPLASALLLSQGRALAEFATINIGHTQPVRLEPPPASIVPADSLSEIG